MTLTKFFFIAFFFIFSLNAFPSQSEVIDTKNDFLELCPIFFAQNTDEISVKFKKFSVVFGKSAMDWTKEDYEALINLASVCNGVKVGDSYVDGQKWINTIEKLYERTYPVTLLSLMTKDFASGLKVKEFKIPNCVDLVKYTGSLDFTEDNSKEIFGVDMLDISSEELKKLVSLTNNCFIFFPDYVKATNSIMTDVERKLNSIMDRALWIIKRRMDYDSWEKRHTDLPLVVVDGHVVIPTMTSKKVRELVLNYNRASITQYRRLTPETASALLQYVDDAESQLTRTKFDEAYIESVTDRIRTMIYRR